MELSRRKVLSLGAVAAAFAAIPVAATIADNPKEKAVGPILLEHVCDGDKSRYTPEEIQEMGKDYPGRHWGCGTRFRWYLGVPPVCPNCGWRYLLSLEDLKNGTYKTVQT